VVKRVRFKAKRQNNRDKSIQLVAPKVKLSRIRGFKVLIRGFWYPRFQKHEVPRFLRIKISGFKGVLRFYRFQGFKVSRFLEIKVLRFLEIEISGF
jgi:hypothetical protein